MTDQEKKRYADEINQIRNELRTDLVNRGLTREVDEFFRAVDEGTLTYKQQLDMHIVSDGATSAPENFVPYKSAAFLRNQLSREESDAIVDASIDQGGPFMTLNETLAHAKKLDADAKN